MLKRIAVAALVGLALTSLMVFATKLELRRRAAERAWDERFAELEPLANQEREKLRSRLHRQGGVDLEAARAEKANEIAVVKAAWSRANEAFCERESARSWRWYLDNLLATKSLPPP
jgi:hypothetical protein